MKIGNYFFPFLELQGFPEYRHFFYKFFVLTPDFWNKNIFDIFFIVFWSVSDIIMIKSVPFLGSHLSISPLYRGLINQFQWDTLNTIRKAVNMPKAQEGHPSQSKPRHVLLNFEDPLGIRVLIMLL